MLGRSESKEKKLPLKIETTAEATSELEPSSSVDDSEPWLGETGTVLFLLEQMPQRIA